jgi:tetrahydromethanopterin S-methyltransferase subunit F
MADETDEYVYDKGVPMVVTPPGAPIFDKLLEDIRYRGQLIARNQKLDSGVSRVGNLNKFASGVYSGKIEGVMMGLTLTLGLLGLLIMGGV